MIIAEIKAETKKVIKLLEKSKLSTQQKTLLKQLSKEIQKQMDCGDWDGAVRLSYYRHEFSKIFKFLEWYAPFREIRKTRDKIQILKGILKG